MKRTSQILFADRLPPLIGGMEMHAGAFVRHFTHHPTYPLAQVVKSPLEKIQHQERPPILFFNSGRWIEEMRLIRKEHPLAPIIYRTGGNEIVKAPLSTCARSHPERQAMWVDILNETVTLIITNSAFTERRLRELGVSTPFAKCVGGVESNPLPEQRREKRKGLTFFCAARFVPYKNHQLLISAFTELCRKNHHCSLILAGDGPLLKEAQLAARNTPHIVFLGRCSTSEIAKQMAHADVYIQLSSDYKTSVPGGSYIHTEGMGRSILEAISAGTYVVAGRCGALSEIVTPERGQLISLDEVVASLEALCEKPPAKRPPTDIFSWEQLFTQYERLYERIDCH